MSDSKRTAMDIGPIDKSAPVKSVVMDLGEDKDDDDQEVTLCVLQLLTKPSLFIYHTILSNL